MAITESLALLLVINVNCADNFASTLSDTVTATEPQHAILGENYGSAFADLVEKDLVDASATPLEYLLTDNAGQHVQDSLTATIRHIANPTEVVSQQDIVSPLLRSWATPSSLLAWDEALTAKPLSLAQPSDNAGILADSISALHRILASFGDNYGSLLNEAVEEEHLGHIKALPSDDLGQHLIDRVGAYAKHPAWMEDLDALVRIRASISDDCGSRLSDLVLKDLKEEQYLALPFDALSISDATLQIIGEYQVEVDDDCSSQFSDLIDYELRGIIRSITPSDALAFQDSLSAVLRSLAKPTDSLIAWSDILSALQRQLAHVSDNRGANWSDLVSALWTYLAQISENQGANWSDLANYLINLADSRYVYPSDSWSPQDSITVVLRTYITVTDAKSMSDSLACLERHLAQFADNQGVNWNDSARHSFAGFKVFWAIKTNRLIMDMDHTDV